MHIFGKKQETLTRKTVNGLEASGIRCEFTPLVPAQEVLGPGILEETIESIAYRHIHYHTVKSAACCLL